MNICSAKLRHHNFWLRNTKQLSLTQKLMRYILQQQAGQQIYHLGENIKINSSRSLGAAIWWTNNGSIPAPVAAYRAVSTPGSIWGAGPATLAASYVNFANPGTYNLATGTEPTWDATNGLKFAAASSQYLTTSGLTPAATWTVAMRFSNAGNAAYAIGAQGTNNTRFLIGPISPSSGTKRRYGYANVLYDSVANCSTSGTIALCANGTSASAYFDGSSDALAGSLNGSWSGTPAQFYLGAFNNNGTPGTYATIYIQAAWIADYDASAYMATLHTIMSAL